MKVYKIEIMIIDFDEIGGDGIKDEIENTKYSNHCISPRIMDIKDIDIGEWRDDNPLNNRNTYLSEYKRLFP